MTTTFDDPDDCFAHPRLAGVYDIVDGARDDLDLYLDLVDSFAAASVLDVGCGTGALASALAGRGVQVVGLDPAAASLAVARSKSNADRVRWLHGTTAVLPASINVDLAVMTGNVAQVFVTDDQWNTTLKAINAAVGGSGRLVFETRIASVRAWETWTRDRTYRRHRLSNGDTLDYWIEVTAVALPLVSFRAHYHFRPDDVIMTSDSTLRFRDETELRTDLDAAGFVVDDIRDAPDRPGRQMVFVATARHRPGRGR